MAKDDELILLRVHAMGALSREGKIEILLDKPETVESEWAERDAARIKMIVYGYFPDPTVDKFEAIVLRRLTTKQLINELGRRTS